MRVHLMGAGGAGVSALARVFLSRGDEVTGCDLKESETTAELEEAGVRTLDQPFVANGNVATAGGCLASQYLAAWVIARFEGVEAARSAMHYVAPVGEKEDYVERAMKNIAPYIDVAWLA